MSVMVVLITWAFRRQRHVFGITAVASVAHVVDVGKAIVLAVVDGEIDHHPLADPCRIDTLSDGNHVTDGIGALDARKGERIALPSPRRNGAGILFGTVGALAHPDIGIVHAAGRHADEDSAGGRSGHPDVPAVDELVEPAMAGQEDGGHRFGDRGHVSSPVSGWRRHCRSPRPSP